MCISCIYIYIFIFIFIFIFYFFSKEGARLLPDPRGAHGSEESLLVGQVSYLFTSIMYIIWN